MTKEEWQNQLIKDSRFDADWIDLVSTLLSTYSTEQLSIIGIKDLDELSTLEVRFIHIINSLLANYNFDNDESDYCNKLIATTIWYIVKQKYHMNATQAQLIATIVGAIAGGKIEKESVMDRFDSNVLEELIEADIPYTSLNFIAKAVIEGHDKIMDYYYSDPDTIAEIYALLADGVFDKVSEVLDFNSNTDNYALDTDIALDLDKIRLIRFLEINKYDYEINSEDDTIIIK